MSSVTPVLYLPWQTKMSAVHAILLLGYSKLFEDLHPPLP